MASNFFLVNAFPGPLAMGLINPLLVALVVSAASIWNVVQDGSCFLGDARRKFAEASFFNGACQFHRDAFQVCLAITPQPSMTHSGVGKTDFHSNGFPSIQKGHRCNRLPHPARHPVFTGTNHCGVPCVSKRTCDCFLSACKLNPSG